VNLGNPRETSMLELATMVPLEDGLKATVEYFRGRKG
jgi:hypothetical protein